MLQCGAGPVRRARLRHSIVAQLYIGRDFWN
jgi:hypothetical protein